MSCMVARWNPWREKQTRAACRIWSRRAFRYDWLTLGMQAPGRLVLLGLVCRRSVRFRLRRGRRNMSDNDVIELVTFHVPAIGSVKLGAVLVCGCVAVQSQASL